MPSTDAAFDSMAESIQNLVGNLATERQHLPSVLILPIRRENRF